MYMRLVDADLVHENRGRFGKARKISILERFRMSIDWALVLGLYYPFQFFYKKKNIPLPYHNYYRTTRTVVTALQSCSCVSGSSP
jgi:hypothetical protein